MSRLDILDKNILLLQLKELVQKNLFAAYDAAKNTYDIATHEENKAENKYDTRGLEASYLAGAQAERVADIKLTLGVLETLQLKKFDETQKIALTALIEIESQGKNSFVWLLPKGGGLNLKYQNFNIQIITPESPLGQNLVGKEVGDIIELVAADKKKEYEVLALL